MIEGGADINSQDMNGNTILMYLFIFDTYCGQARYYNEGFLYEADHFWENFDEVALEILEYLLKNKTDVRIKNKKGDTVIDIFKSLDWDNELYDTCVKIFKKYNYDIWSKQ